MSVVQKQQTFGHHAADPPDLVLGNILVCLVGLSYDLSEVAPLRVLHQHTEHHSLALGYLISLHKAMIEGDDVGVFELGQHLCLSQCFQDLELGTAIYVYHFKREILWKL